MYCSHTHSHSTGKQECDKHEYGEIMDTVLDRSSHGKDRFRAGNHINAVCIDTNIHFIRD